MKKPNTLIEKHVAIQKIGTDVELPSEVYRILGVRSVRIIGSQVEIGNGGDFCEISQARAAIDWLANQLGGEIDWKYPRE